EVGLARGAGWRRIIVEKPFGTDLESAHKLNDQLHSIFDEDEIYRIDHFLGKETVQNLMVFRFANTLFEPIWNRHFIDHVQISALETVDVGSRAGYYDESGILRDMFQNHIMQLLTLTAMEAPVAFEAGPLRDEKVKVLRALDMVKPEEVGDRTVRAQYQGYLDAEGVAEDSKTPTFAAIQLGIRNWRWHGVPFYLRSGKALHKKLTEIVVQFKETPLQYFQQNSGLMPTPNRLGICIQPDEGFHLRISSKQPGAGFKTVPTDLTFHFDDKFGKSALPEAYERLLLDAMQGDPSLFARSDEIEWSWRVVDKIIEGWSGDAAPGMATYEKGSWGPAEANELLNKTGRNWQYGCIHED
ncbi:MAG: glucose-6-phosphate dehydrogenase, partial [Chloroflexi bacterium]|nr:glucose-6-phosphate dehydrogenase [Chloroflexota bacterium]